MDNLDAIIAYEQGELSPTATLELFASLVQSGIAWTLQGHYGRTATALIARGFLTRAGTITAEGEAAVAA